MPDLNWLEFPTMTVTIRLSWNSLRACNSVAAGSQLLGNDPFPFFSFLRNAFPYPEIDDGLMGIAKEPALSRFDSASAGRKHRKPIS